MCGPGIIRPVQKSVIFRSKHRKEQPSNLIFLASRHFVAPTLTSSLGIRLPISASIDLLVDTARTCTNIFKIFTRYVSAIELAEIEQNMTLRQASLELLVQNSLDYIVAVAFLLWAFTFSGSATHAPSSLCL